MSKPAKIRVSHVERAPSANNRMQRSVTDKVLGRGRGHAAAKYVRRARVLKRLWAGADAGR